MFYVISINAGCKLYNAILNYCRCFRIYILEENWIPLRHLTCHERRACCSCLAFCSIDSIGIETFVSYSFIFSKQFYFVFSGLKIIGDGNPDNNLESHCASSLLMYRNHLLYATYYFLTCREKQTQIMNTSYAKTCALTDERHHFRFIPWFYFFFFCKTQRPFVRNIFITSERPDQQRMYLKRTSQAWGPPLIIVYSLRISKTRSLVEIR
jgi:hypothetical protein